MIFYYTQILYFYFIISFYYLLSTFFCNFFFFFFTSPILKLKRYQLIFLLDWLHQFFYIQIYFYFLIEVY